MEVVRWSAVVPGGLLSVLVDRHAGRAGGGRGGCRGEHPVQDDARYSDEPSRNDQITGAAGSHARTRANIAKALRLGIPIRASIVEVLDGQRTGQARADLRRLGVTRIKTDRKRAIGNGAGGGLPSVSELGGWGGERKVAVATDGSVGPCSIGVRFLAAGNVREAPLRDILEGAAWRRLLERVPVRAGGCNPDNGCNPKGDSEDCAPAESIWEPDE